MKIKELEDYYWFPTILRKYQMEFIGILVSKFSLYKTVAEDIKMLLIASNITKIVDLCSGSGEAAISVHRAINLPHLQLTLTDLYPQQIPALPNITYAPNAIDALQIPIEKDTFYTMYNAFHHFDKEEQKLLIEKIYEAKAQLYLVEIVRPTLMNFVQVTLAATLGVLFLCPFIRPFEWKRLLFTYIFPLNMLTVAIDGYISILKSKNVQQYRKRISEIIPFATNTKVSEHFQFPTYITTIQILAI
jgi:hypothetical protein